MPLYTMRVASGVSFMTADSAENTLYMVAPRAKQLLVARLADCTPIAEIDVGDGAYWVLAGREK